MIYCSSAAWAQVENDPLSLDSYLIDFAQRHNLSLIYNTEDIAEYIHVDITVPADNPSLLSQYLEENYDLEVMIQEGVYTVRKKKYFQLYGYVVDSLSGEYLPYVTIYFNDHHIRTTTVDGYYSIRAPEGRQTIRLTYLGEFSRRIDFELDKDKQLNLSFSTLLELPEVVVEENYEDYFSGNVSSYVHRDLMTIADKTPSLGGSNDLLHTTRMQAGIQSGAGGVGGLFVRGSGNDQNLYLIDGVEIYNPFHSLGLSSIFTPETTKDLKVFKDYIHPKYGDRSSSVIDIRIKDGNSEKPKFTLGVNPQDYFGSLELPIGLNNSSIFGYARTTSLGFGFKKIIRESIFPEREAEGSLPFLDLILKSKFQINSSQALYLTYFRTRDRLRVELEEESEVSNNSYENRLSWGNEVLSANLKSILTKNLYVSSTISLNNYFSQYGLFFSEETVDDSDEDLFFEEVASDNNNLEAKTQLDYYLNNSLSVSSGFGYSRRVFTPDINLIDEDSEELSGLENIDYEDVESIDDNLKIQADKYYVYSALSLHLSKFSGFLGVRRVLFRTDGEIFRDMQPRLNLEWVIGPQLSVSGSYTSTRQYLHLLAPSELHLPRDLWYPSIGGLVPERTTQQSIRLKHNFSPRWIYDVSIYLKNTTGRTFSSLDSLENSIAIQNLNVIIGEADSRGVEASLFYNGQNLKASISYALSRSERQYEAINLGDAFSFQFERRHEIKGTFFHDMRSGITLGANFYLSSGHPFLVTDGLDLNTGINVVDFNSPGQYNTRRDSWRHRIDLSLSYQRVMYGMEHYLKLNLYNATYVMHPLYYLQDGIEINPQFSIPLIPSLAYRIKF